MQAISFRTYQPGDEPAIVALWNRRLTKDLMTRRRFRNLVLLDPNFDPQGLRLAFEGEELVGCLYAVRRLLPMVGTELEPAHGWIPFFFTAKHRERQGIAGRLLQEAIEFLRECGRTKVFFSSYAPNYVVPGIDAEHYPEGKLFLEKNGFARQYSAVAMDMSLVDFEIPDEAAELKRTRMAEGYTFRQAEDRDLYELIRFASDVFNPDWGRAIREGILQGLPLEQILIARRQQTLVGFCMHGGYELVRERFGPFGVDPQEQGKGLGKILLYDCLANMRAQALHGAWFLWTGEESAAGRLYKKVGFRTTRRFDIVWKPI